MPDIYKYTFAKNALLRVADSCTLQKCRAENACTVRLANGAREVLAKCPTRLTNRSHRDSTKILISNNKIYRS